MNDTLDKILDDQKLYRFLDVNTLLEVFQDLEISCQPYSLENINEKSEELGGMPKLLQEYFFKIGDIEKKDEDDEDYNLLEDSSGCYINELDGVYILTSKMLKKQYGDAAENENNDYLIFGSEILDQSEEFGIKLVDIHNENPEIFSSGDLDGMIKEDGKIFGVIKAVKTLKEFFSLTALSAYEA